MSRVHELLSVKRNLQNCARARGNKVESLNGKLNAELKKEANLMGFKNLPFLNREGP